MGQEASQHARRLPTGQTEFLVALRAWDGRWLTLRSDGCVRLVPDRCKLRLSCRPSRGGAAGTPVVIGGDTHGWLLLDDSRRLSRAKLTPKPADATQLRLTFCEDGTVALAIESSGLSPRGDAPDFVSAAVATPGHGSLAHTALSSHSVHNSRSVSTTAGANAGPQLAQKWLLEFYLTPPGTLATPTATADAPTPSATHAHTHHHSATSLTEWCRCCHLDAADWEEALRWGDFDAFRLVLSLSLPLAAVEDGLAPFNPLITVAGAPFRAEAAPYRALSDLVTAAAYLLRTRKLPPSRVTAKAMTQFVEAHAAACDVASGQEAGGDGPVAALAACVVYVCVRVAEAGVPADSAEVFATSVLDRTEAACFARPGLRDAVHPLPVLSFAVQAQRRFKELRARWADPAQPPAASERGFAHVSPAALPPLTPPQGPVAVPSLAVPPPVADAEAASQDYDEASTPPAVQHTSRQLSSPPAFPPGDAPPPFVQPRVPQTAPELELACLEARCEALKRNVAAQHEGALRSRAVIADQGATIRALAVLLVGAFATMMALFSVDVPPFVALLEGCAVAAAVAVFYHVPVRGLWPAALAACRGLAAP